MTDRKIDEALEALEAIDTPFRRTSEPYAEKMDTIRRVLERCQDELAMLRDAYGAAVQRLQELGETEVSLERQRVPDREYPISCNVCGRWLYKEDYEQLTVALEPDSHIDPLTGAPKNGA